MNSISFDIVKNIIEKKKYDVVTEFAHMEYPDKGELIVTEYTGKDVRAYKDNKNRTRILCPKDMTPIQEGHVVEAIARGTIFDDADDINNNAEFIEKTSIPHAAMINSGKDVPKKLKPMIAIIIGKMDEDGSFSVDDADRINGNNFVKDVVCCKDKGSAVTDVVDNYIDKNDEDFYTPEMGKDVTDLDKEVDDIRDTDFEDIITDDDTVESYDDIDMDEIESDPSDKNDEDIDDESNDETDTTDDSTDDESETDDDKLPAEKVDEFYTRLKEELNDEPYQEGFLSKKPKKLKPIPRDVVAYITVEMNDISSANDQAMLSGYTCSKIELVDFYLTVLDTQDPRYIVPHNKQYLENMKRELENLLAQILRIRPINRMDRVWRVNVNYPEGWRG